MQCLLQDESCRSANFRKNETCEERKNCELLHTVDSEEPDEYLKNDENFDYYVLVKPERVSMHGKVKIIFYFTCIIHTDLDFLMNEIQYMDHFLSKDSISATFPFFRIFFSSHVGLCRPTLVNKASRKLYIVSLIYSHYTVFIYSHVP